MCVCSLRYEACKHACAVSQCHLWPLQVYNIFPHYLTDGVICGKKLQNIKRVFSFSLQLWSEAFFILRIIQRGIINVQTSACKVPIILVIFRRTLIFLTDFRKIFKSRETSTSGSPAVPLSLTGTQMDGRTDKTKLTVAFRIPANAFTIWTHPKLKLYYSSKNT